MRVQLKRWLRRALIGTLVAVGLGTSWAGYLRLSGNFHAVEEGKVYRSAQLSGSQLADRIRTIGIRSVINLRGSNPGRAWYDEEISVTSSTDTAHFDFAMSSGRELTADEITTLVQLLSRAPRPLLIHCEAGADRTGLAVALYALLVANKTAEEAGAQLSFRYGHFPWLGNSTSAMDRTLQRVVSGSH